MYYVPVHCKVRKLVRQYGHLKLNTNHKELSQPLHLYQAVLPVASQLLTILYLSQFQSLTDTYFTLEWRALLVDGKDSWKQYILTEFAETQ